MLAGSSARKAISASAGGPGTPMEGSSIGPDPRVRPDSFRLRRSAGGTGEYGGAGAVTARAAVLLADCADKHQIHARPRHGQHRERLFRVGCLEHPIAFLGQDAVRSPAHQLSLVDHENRIGLNEHAGSQWTNRL